MIFYAITLWYVRFTPSDFIAKNGFLIRSNFSLTNKAFWGNRLMNIFWEIWNSMWWMWTRMSDKRKECIFHFTCKCTSIFCMNALEKVAKNWLKSDVKDSFKDLLWIYSRIGQNRLLSRKCTKHWKQRKLKIVRKYENTKSVKLRQKR